MKKLFAILLLFACLGAAAQTTKVRGRVTDKDTGEGIPFAGVFFKGTQTGISTDLDGYYNIETREKVTTVVCQILGYNTEEAEITSGSFNALDFELELTDNRLNAVVVKADNSRVRRLLRNISENRDRNNPDAKSGYSCESYTRLELDLTHAEEQLTGKRFLKEFGFVFDYMDTSSISGVPYLPVMISESVSRRYHNREPELDREVLEANQVSGINKDNNLLSQFTGSLLLKNNFYKDFVQIFGIQFPSPIQSGGLMFYDYYIIDSLQIDNHKNYYVRYHPKKYSTSPAFDGEMYIDTHDWALRSIHAKMLHGGNVNWIRDIVVDAEFQYDDKDSTGHLQISGYKYL